MKRLDDESYEDYKARQKASNRVVNNYLKGRLAWDSRQGTAVQSNKLSKETRRQYRDYRKNLRKAQ